MLGVVFARSVQTRQVGSEAAGFRLVYPPGGRTLRIEAWGYWSPEVAAAFGRESASACRELSGPVSLVFDAMRLKPQSADGQGALRVMMKSVAGARISGGRVLVDNILTRMQLLRIAKECGLDRLLQFVVRSEGDEPVTDEG